MEKFTKQETEKAYAEKFLKYYNKYSRKEISFLRNGEQGAKNEPDIVCSDGIYIEIVSSMYSEKQKKFEKHVEKNGGKSGNLFIDGVEVYEKGISIIEPDMKAFCFIRDKITEKFSKKYDVGDDKQKLILLVTPDTPGTSQEDYKEYFLTCPISLAEDAIYDEIWYMQQYMHHGNNRIFGNIVEIGDQIWSIFLVSEKYIIL